MTNLQEWKAKFLLIVRKLRRKQIYGRQSLIFLNAHNPYIENKVFTIFCGHQLTLACSTENFKMNVTSMPLDRTVTGVTYLFLKSHPLLSILYLIIFFNIYRCNRSIYTFYRKQDAQIERKIQARVDFSKTRDMH